ncbi:MAG: DUF2256 domain-containing protein [Verrucomicrobiota bacterium]
MRIKGKAVKKTDLPEKICLQCHRPFSWRKKWERDWGSITCCSEACKGELKRTRHAPRNGS